jgi:hypothetical protein
MPQRQGEDMAYVDLELGEDDNTEPVELSARDRRLITQSYDLSVNTLLEQWDDKTLRLPEIQRQYVWDNGRASRLIESLLLNIPIPVVYFSETEDVNYLVIDGHQRIYSIVRYLQNEFALGGLKILTDLNRKRFRQLSERDQRQLRTRVIRAIIISQDSDPMMQFEVFERLNTGSIALSAQEVRNSTHRGPMNEKIKEFTLLPEFRHCVGTSKPRPRMVDNELLLRFLALRADWENYRPPLSRFLNAFMTDANRLDDAGLDEAERAVTTACHGLFGVLGPAAFRLTDRRGVPTDRALNRALAEVQLAAFSWVSDPEQLNKRRGQIVASLGLLYERQPFLDSIQRATGDRRRTHRRLGMICEALSLAGVELAVEVPYELAE